MRGHCGPGHAGRLAQRGEVDHAITGAGAGRETAASVAEHAKAVGVVEVEPGVMTFGQIEQRIDRRTVTVHAEHQVGDDEFVARPALRKLAFELGHIQMAIARERGT